VQIIGQYTKSTSHDSNCVEADRAFQFRDNGLIHANEAISQIGLTV